MESQNHFYGHSAAFAACVGRSRPRHIRGLVQHGWTAVSPVATHFRDFPGLGLPGSGSGRLLVWSHQSRAWDPAEERHATTPIGAQFAYLARVAAGAAPRPRDERDEVVLMPVHGIQTQRVRGDHAGLAQRWREQEGPATACLYAADADDPQILEAYLRAGHRVVVLGERMDAAFLWRLWTMLGRARRVVSNRLSTPVLYGAHLGASVGVYGDALRIDGETRDQNDRVRELWPELHGEQVSPEARHVVDLELGVPHLLDGPALERALGWDGSTLATGLQFWTTSPARRAVVNLRRRADVPSTPTAPAPLDQEAPAGLSFGPWLRAAMSYLPRPLPRQIPAVGEEQEPVLVAG